jgi:prepilin-type N-terminal cleavage/methylation domain-containing protein
MKRSAQGGFTLVEMMVVVALIAIITSIAIVYVKPNTRPIDIAARFAAFVEHANRLAVRDGVVGTANALSEGSKRRTRITAAAGPPVTFYLEVLVESPSLAWEQVDAFALPNSVDADGYAMKVGTHAELSVTPGLSTSWSTFVLSCFPTGTCDGATLFFSSQSGATHTRKARVSVLPLGSSTHVQPSWD